jgi:hypothetical protein
VDYPEKLDRLTTFFRPIVAIPILVILSLLSGSYSAGDSSDEVRLRLSSAGIVFLPLVLLILFRQKYPRWWFNWNYSLTAFSIRVAAYLTLLRDEYPSPDEEQAVHLDIVYPNAATDLNRWLPLIKWFLAIPHYIVLFFLSIAAIVAVVIAWFAILITGNYPRSLFDFVVGVIRWFLRVGAYAFLLVTDRYPPFSLD